MTIKELENLTGLSNTEIQAYYAKGLIGREENHNLVFNSEDAKNIGLIRKLTQFCLNENDIAKVLCFIKNKEQGKAAKILQNLRKEKSCKIHEEQKSLDVLDCIIFEIQNNGI